MTVSDSYNLVSTSIPRGSFGCALLLQAMSGKVGSQCHVPGGVPVAKAAHPKLPQKQLKSGVVVKEVCALSDCTVTAARIQNHQTKAGGVLRDGKDIDKMPTSAHCTKDDWQFVLGPVYAVSMEIKIFVRQEGSAENIKEANAKLRGMVLRKSAAWNNAQIVGEAVSLLLKSAILMAHQRDDTTGMRTLQNYFGQLSQGKGSSVAKVPAGSLWTGPENHFEKYTSNVSWTQEDAYAGTPEKGGIQVLQFRLNVFNQSVSQALLTHLNAHGITRAFTFEEVHLGWMLTVPATPVTPALQDADTPLCFKGNGKDACYKGMAECIQNCQKKVQATIVAKQKQKAAQNMGGR